MNGRNVVVAVSGAIVILAAVSMLWEIDARAGPYERPLAPAATPLAVEGHYLASGPRGTVGPGGICIPDEPGGTCGPARLDVDLQLRGLPAFGPDAQYVAFLTDGPEPVLRLGVLEPRDGGHHVTVDEERDARGYAALVVSLETRSGAAAPSPMIVYMEDVSGQGGTSPYDLSGAAVVTVGDGSGSVRTTEIGGYSISVTAIGELHGAPRVAGWSYHAWLEPEPGAPGPTYLGAWEWRDDGSGHAVLDARVETVRLEDQQRLVTTLVPTATVVDGVQIQGLEAFETSLGDDRQ